MKKIRNTFFLLLIFICFSTSVKSQCNAWFVFFSSGSYNCVTNLSVGNYTINGNTFPVTFTIVNTVTNATFCTAVAPSNTGTFNPIPVGTYSVFMTSAVPGCTNVVVFQVVSPVSPSNIQFINPVMVSCNGGNNGSMGASVTGPFIAPFTYTWSNGSFSQTAINLPAGTYTVTIKDSQGCTLANTVQVTEPAPMASSFANTVTPCPNGTLSTVINTNGGTPPFTYTVNGTPVAGNIANNVAAGIATLITKDAANCLKTNTITIISPAGPTIANTITKPSCIGTLNGAVTTTISGAPLAYSYTWAPGGANTSSINNIGVGNYTVTFKDGNSCITKSVIAVTPLNSMTANVITVPENCSASDGAFTLNMSGGSAPYTFSTVTFGSSNNNFLNNLTSGAYTTIVSDAANCKDTVKFVIGNLSTVSVSIVSFTPVLCFGNCTGKVQLTVLNGISPITYSASGTPTTANSLVSNLCAGLVNIKVIDAIGCPATTTINFPTPPVFSYSATNPAPVCIGKTITLQGSAAGGVGAHTFIWNPGSLVGQTVSITASATTVYSLNVYDANNCTLPPFTVTVNVNPPISINLNSSNSGICPGTTAQISPTITGGDGVYNYNWIPGNLTSPSIFVQNIVVPVYTLTVNDFCGSPTAIIEVTINLFPVVIPTFFTSDTAGCEPFCIQFTNTTPKSTNIIWNYGDKPFEQQGSITNYCYDRSGSYDLRITVNDSNNCKAGFTYTGAINVLKKPDANFTSDPVLITLDNDQDVLFKPINSATLYQWYVNGNFLASTPKIHYSFPDTGCVPFRLIAINADNCRDTVDKNICVIEGFNIWVPNCFSPNNDGKNDVFMPKGTGWIERGYVFEIFNRWGTRIYHTNNMNDSWDGKTKNLYDQDDAYFWHVSVTDNLNNEYNYKGLVYILK